MKQSNRKQLRRRPTKKTDGRVFEERAADRCPFKSARAPVSVTTWAYTTAKDLIRLLRLSEDYRENCRERDKDKEEKRGGSLSLCLCAPRLSVSGI